MSNRIVLFIVIVLGILSTAEFLSVITTTNPSTVPTTTLWLVYACLYISLTALLGLIWHFVRMILPKRKVRTGLIVSIRQASLAALLIVLCSFFATLGIFHIWTLLPLAIAVVLIEFFFQADKRAHATLTYDPDKADN